MLIRFMSAPFFEFLGLVTVLFNVADFQRLKGSVVRLRPSELVKIADIHLREIFSLMNFCRYFACEEIHFGPNHPRR